jgi:hypothetical protein
MEDAAMKVRHLLVFVISFLAFLLPVNAGKKDSVQGVVEGPGGAVLANAEVSLTNQAGGEPRVTTTDEDGVFAFSNVPPGDYTLLVKSPGFQDGQVTVTVGSAAVPRLRVKLKVAEVSQQVTVSANVLLAGENNNAFQMNGRLLTNVPAKDGDALAIPSLFLDNSMFGANGPTLLVDGVEVESVDLPASSVKDVVVDRNPFSAEFGRPGKGRLEITTRRGVHSRYRGTVLGIYRTSDLYARNAFAVSKPYEERKLLEGQVDGPMPFFGDRATFFVSGRYRNFADDTVVNASTLTGPFVTNLDTPTLATTLFGRMDLRINKIHKATFFYRYKNKEQDNLLANNFDLPEHAINSLNHANEFRMVETANLSSDVMNQIRLGYKDESQSTSSVSNQLGIVVLGSFSSGGAQVAQGITERYGDLEDVASVSSGRHLLRFGGGVKPRFYNAYDASNFGGTFTFSSLADLQNGTPLKFEQNTGNPATSFSWTEAYTFFQDDFHLRHNLAFLVGIRQEYQSSLSYAQSLCPRAAFAYSLGDGRTVIRGGVGIFYDREPYQMMKESRLYDGFSIRETSIPHPAYPNPFAPTANGAASVTQNLLNVVRIGPGLRLPYLVNGSLSVERKVGHGENYVTLELATVRGVGLYRMRDINAPFPGSTVRPDPNFLTIDQFESSASSRGYSASLSYRGQWRKLQIMGKYTLARTLDSASSMFSLPANSYDADADWARADFDRRQQLNVVGVYSLPSGFMASVVFNAWSGLPYNIITGLDTNDPTVVNDRPAGLWRNAGQGAGYMNLDLRLSRRYRLAKREHAPTVEWAVDAFNALNHVNYRNYIGVMTSTFFGRADAANPPRQIQISGRFSF